MYLVKTKFNLNFLTCNLFYCSIDNIFNLFKTCAHTDVNTSTNCFEKCYIIRIIYIRNINIYNTKWIKKTICSLLGFFFAPSSYYVYNIRLYSFDSNSNVQLFIIRTMLILKFYTTSLNNKLELKINWKSLSCVNATNNTENPTDITKVKKKKKLLLRKWKVFYWLEKNRIMCLHTAFSWRLTIESSQNVYSSTFTATSFTYPTNRL